MSVQLLQDPVDVTINGDEIFVEEDNSVVEVALNNSIEVLMENVVIDLTKTDDEVVVVEDTGDNSTGKDPRTQARKALGIDSTSFSISATSSSPPMQCPVARLATTHFLEIFLGVFRQSPEPFPSSHCSDN